MPRSISRFLVPLGIVGAGIVVAAWMVMSRPQAAAKPTEEKIWPVPVATVAVVDMRPDIVLFGEVRAARVAEIRAEVAGRLVELAPAFVDGSFVATGTPLALVEPQDYEYRLAEQRAELGRADAQLTELRRELEWESALADNAERQVELARRGLERSEKLAAQGRESRKARDDAEAALASAEQNRLQRAQNVARLRTRIAQQQAAYEKAQAAHAMAERELGKTRISAPFDGYLADVDLALGQRVAVGETLARLLAASEPEVRFDLPEADFGRLLAAAGGVDALLGQPLTVTWRLGDSVREFSARLTRLGAEIDPTLGGVRLIATLADAAGDSGLRAGAFVEVRLPDVTYRDVVRLPARALSETGTIYAVKDGRLVELEPTVVRELGDEVLVRAPLASGDTVVARSFSGIGPGLRVRPL